MNGRYLWSAKALSHWKPGGTAPGMGSAAENKALKARFNWLVNPRSLAVNRAFSAVTYLDDSKTWGVAPGFR